MNIGLIQIMGLACLILAGCGGKQEPIKYTVNDPKDANSTWRTEKPLTYPEALANGHCPISLPVEAKNIQFVDFYAGYGGFSHHVRFEAPVEVCRDRARLIISEHNARETQESRKLPTRAEALTGSRGKDLAQNAKKWEPVSQAAWFDSDLIRKGEVWGDGGSHRPVVLIDLDRGIFYYRLTD